MDEVMEMFSTIASLLMMLSVTIEFDIMAPLAMDT